MSKPVIPLGLGKSHLRVEHELDDESIQLFLDAAIDRTLQEVGLAGVLERDHETRTTLATFGFMYPVESIVSVEKMDATGSFQVVPADEYVLSGTHDERQILTLSKEAGHVSGSSYVVKWKAGFGDKLPAWFQLAAFFLLGHYYENRGSVLLGQGVSAVEVPMGFVHLCAPHRRWFFA